MKDDRRDDAPYVILIAGPNGAGKTRFAEQFLPEEASCPNFINADLIAKGLSPFQPDRMALQASRLMIRAMDHHFRLRDSFAVETTLAARSYLRRIVEWKDAGYSVTMVFFRLPSVELAIRRVAFRVREGGHDIPEHVIRRRYEAGLKNLEHYKKLVHHWMIMDNSGVAPVVLNEGVNP